MYAQSIVPLVVMAFNFLLKSVVLIRQYKYSVDIFLFGTIPNTPCLVVTGYTFIDTDPIVAPLDKIIELVGITHADEF